MSLQPLTCIFFIFFSIFGFVFCLLDARLISLLQDEI